MNQGIPSQWDVRTVVDLTKMDLIILPETRRLLARVVWSEKADLASRRLLAIAPQLYATLQAMLAAHDGAEECDWEAARELLSQISA